jgi:hypothetical protein
MSLHLVEMVIAMMAGMLVFHMLPLQLSSTSFEYQLGMAVFMTVPMVAWMRVRGHAWRDTVEMSVGMLAPWAAVVALVALGAASIAPWLAYLDGPAMLLGMLAVMLLQHSRVGSGVHAHSGATG